MPRPQKGPRLYTRAQGGQIRYYADLRSVGRGRIALIPEGETQATADPVVAQKLFAVYLEEIQERRRDGVLLGVRSRATLAEYASSHLVKKAKSGKVTETHLGGLEAQLRTAVEFFGTDRDVATLRVEDIQAYTDYLAGKENGRGRTISSSTQARYLSALSNLFRRAQGEGLIRGVNPVSALLDKPSQAAVEAPWLEVWEGALLLESARTFPYGAETPPAAGERLRVAIEDVLGAGPSAVGEFVDRMRAAGKLTDPERVSAYCNGTKIPTRGYLLTAAQVLGLPESRLWLPVGRVKSPRVRVSPLLYPLTATFLLTGGRVAEVLGLELCDVNLRNGTLAIRPNPWRRIKNRQSRRVLRLWPQLRAVLEPWIEDRRASGAGDHDLVFPSPHTGKMYDNFHKALDRIATRAGWGPGEVRPKAFRHAYCSARLQTLDNGHPVSEFTVSKELGHGGQHMIRKVYGHLGVIRHRAEVVEFRIEQHQEVIPPERLRALLRIA